jgi:hypothetical protein
MVTAPGEQQHGGGEVATVLVSSFRRPAPVSARSSASGSRRRRAARISVSVAAWASPRAGLSADGHQPSLRAVIAGTGHDNIAGRTQLSAGTSMKAPSVPGCQDEGYANRS